MNIHNSRSVGPIIAELDVLPPFGRTIGMIVAGVILTSRIGSEQRLERLWRVRSRHWTTRAEYGQKIGRLSPPQGPAVDLFAGLPRPTSRIVGFAKSFGALPSGRLVRGARSSIFYKAYATTARELQGRDAATAHIEFLTGSPDTEIHARLIHDATRLAQPRAKFYGKL